MTMLLPRGTCRRHPEHDGRITAQVGAIVEA